MSIIEKHGFYVAAAFVVLVLLTAVFGWNACAGSRQDEIYNRTLQLIDDKKAVEKDLAATRKQLSENKKELQAAQRASKKKDSRIKELTEEIKSQNETISALESKLQAFEKEIRELREELKTLKEQSQDEDVTVSEDEPAPVVSSGWHPQAQCRVTGFTYKPGDSSVKLKVQYKSGKYEKNDPKTSKTGNDGAQYFVIESLPAGLQIVVPDGYTVNVDGRKDYVAKIDPNNIEGSALDYTSNVEYYKGANGKKIPARTFTSGEVFIIMKQSGMTIRPPFATAPRR